MAIATIVKREERERETETKRRGRDRDSIFEEKIYSKKVLDQGENVHTSHDFWLSIFPFANFYDFIWISEIFVWLWIISIKLSKKETIIKSNRQRFSKYNGNSKELRNWETNRQI